MGGLIEDDDFSAILLHSAVDNGVGSLVADGRSIVVGSIKGAMDGAIINNGSLEFQGAGGVHVDFSSDEGEKLVITGLDDTDMIQFEPSAVWIERRVSIFQASGLSWRTAPGSQAETRRQLFAVGFPDHRRWHSTRAIQHFELSII
jgi:hypothetical protein